MSSNIFEYTIPWDKKTPENIEEEIKNQVANFPLSDAKKITLVLKCTPQIFKMEIHKNTNLTATKNFNNATVQEIDLNDSKKFKKQFSEITNKVVKENKPVKLEFSQNLNESINNNNINKSTSINTDSCNLSKKSLERSMENKEPLNLTKQNIDDDKKVQDNSNELNRKISKLKEISIDSTESSDVDTAKEFKSTGKLMDNQNSAIAKNTESNTKNITTDVSSSNDESTNVNTAKEISKSIPHEGQPLCVKTTHESDSNKDSQKNENIENVLLVKDTENNIIGTSEKVPKKVLNSNSFEKETTDVGTGSEIKTFSVKEYLEDPKSSINKEGLINVNAKSETREEDEKEEESNLKVVTNNELKTLPSDVQSEKILENDTQESKPTIVDGDKEIKIIEKKEDIETPNIVPQKEIISVNVSEIDDKNQQKEVSKFPPDEVKLHNDISKVERGIENLQPTIQDTNKISPKNSNNMIKEDPNNAFKSKDKEINIINKSSELKINGESIEANTQEDVKDTNVKSEEKEKKVLRSNEIQVKASSDISEKELEEQVKEMPKNFVKQHVKIPSNVDENKMKVEVIKDELPKKYNQEENKNSGKDNEKQSEDNFKLINKEKILPTEIKKDCEPLILTEKMENKINAKIPESQTKENTNLDIKQIESSIKTDENPKICKSEEPLKSSILNGTEVIPKTSNEKIDNKPLETSKQKLNEIENNESKSQDSKKSTNKNVDTTIKKEELGTMKSEIIKPKKKYNLRNPLLSITIDEIVESSEKKLSTNTLPNDLLIQSDTNNSSTSDTLQSIDNTKNFKIKKKRSNKSKKNHPCDSETKSTNLNIPLLIGMTSIAIIATIMIIKRQ